MHVLAVFQVVEGNHFVLDAFVHGYAKIIEGEIFGLAGVKRIEMVGARVLLVGGAQVVVISRPIRFCLQFQRDMLKGYILDLIGRISVKEDAVFAAAVDVLEAYIFDMTEAGAFSSRERRDGNRLSAAPPMLFGEVACVDIDIGEERVFDASVIAQLQGNASVGFVDIAVLHDDVFEK